LSANLLTRIRKHYLRVPPDQISFDKRAFVCDNSVIRTHLEDICRAFLLGYHAALDDPAPHLLSRALNSRLPPRLRGFAFEGAAMGLCLLDRLSFSPKIRLLRFIDPAAPHVYLLHVGAGWAIARLPWLRSHPRPLLDTLDPLLRWLAIDGYGFHEGFFHTRTAIRAQRRPSRLPSHLAPLFDRGLGRSLWFTEGASVPRIVSTIQAFPPPRRADLWSGVGLAATYAAGAAPADLSRLCESAGPHAIWLAQGAAFAAKARHAAQALEPATERACEIFCGASASSAAAATDEARRGLPSGLPGFELWRHRIAHLLCARDSQLTAS
jgi:enediyne biosynthesis protein E3